MAQVPAVTDSAILAELGERLARQRVRRNLTQAALAREAGISKRTLVRLESGESTQLTNLLRVLRALGLLGHLDALLPPPTPSPLEQLRAAARTKERRRASPRGGQNKRQGDTKAWTWGDGSSPSPTEGGSP
jgi:transcriptional regulator with XRE-family HTH domain